MKYNYFQYMIYNILLFLLLLLNAHAQVSYHNLKLFFEATYDRNKDGTANQSEIIDYFRLMEPDQDFQETDVQPMLQFLDSNGDQQVSLSQLVDMAKIKISFKPGHKQIHLGFTNNEQQMQVMWVSTPEKYQKPVVYYGKLPGNLKQKVDGEFDSYNVGHWGFHGRIYRAVMKDLQPNRKYYYKVGDEMTQTYSGIKHFTAPPLRVQQLDEVNMAVFGDMGTFAPLGHFVINQIAKDHLTKPFNFVFLTGDIAYAGMNSQKTGQFEPIWDLFGQMTEKFAAYTSFMPGVGNHQSYYGFTSYFKRYHLPRKVQDQTNLWFSFDYGQVHILHFSSEHDYKLDSAQYKFIEEDLAKARSNPNIQWIIAGCHRPFYSSSKRESNMTNLAKSLEDLMVKYGVDIVQNGHEHSYERSYPMYKGQSKKERANATHFIDPQYPIYVVQGTAGALVKKQFKKEQPEYTVKRMNRYGYGRIIVKGNKLKYQFIVIPTGKVVDEWNIIKDVKSKQLLS